MIVISKIVAALFALLLAVSFTFWGAIGVANYSASFIAFSLVAAASFAGYRRVVLASGAKEEPASKEEEEDEPKESKMSLLLKTYKGWLFPFRLASYALFVLVFFYFANNNLLNVFAFLTGIAAIAYFGSYFYTFF